jgi:L-lactate dehydrogenase complex protein LldE
MIRHGYAELFANDPDWLPRAQAVAERTYEFSQYLVDELGLTNVGAKFSGQLTYHPSCHLLRDLDVDHQPRALLDAIHGAEIVPLPHADECCGFGGIFAVEHAKISSAMLARKIDAIDQTGVQTVVTCDTGCLMNIYGGLQKQAHPQRVVHLAEVLAGAIEAE